MIEQAKEIIGSPKGAVTSAVGTAGAGVATFMEVLPSILGICATTSGIILSAILGYKYWIEIGLLKSAAEAAKCRLEKGLPCNRHGEREALRKREAE